MLSVHIRKARKSKSLLSRKAFLSKLEKLEIVKLDEIRLTSEIKSLSSLDGFNAELALQYIRVIQADEKLDVLKLIP